MPISLGLRSRGTWEGSTYGPVVNEGSRVGIIREAKEKVPAVCGCQCGDRLFLPIKAKGISYQRIPNFAA